MVTDLNGYTKEEFLIELDTWFRIENHSQNFNKPSEIHHFSMYLDHEFYSLLFTKSKIYNQ